MQINESGKLAFKTTGTAIRTSKNHLTALSIGQEQEEERTDRNIDPTKYMTAKETRKWKRLSGKKQQQYIEEGIKTAKRTMRAKSGIFQEENLTQTAEKKVAKQYLEDIRNRVEADRIIGEEPILERQKIKQTKKWKNETVREPDEKSASVSDRMSYSGKEKAGVRYTVPVEKIPDNTTSITPVSTTGKEMTKNVAVTSAETGVAATGVGTVALAGKKAADKFREYMQTHTVAGEQALQDVQSKIQGIKAENQKIDSFPAVVKYVAASVGASVLSFVAVIMQGIISIITLVISVLIGLLVPIIAIISVISAIVSIIAALTTSDDPAGYGLPDFVTQDMMQAFFETQEESGIPVSSGIAQLIVESGFGSYGPGGENGRGLSGLAYNYHNLFGIKYFSGDQYATGSVNMQTGEETSGGDSYEIVAGFSIYPDYAACIKQRAWMLNRSPYLSYISTYKNKNDGKYTKQDADNFVQGIKNAGWATSNAYVENCKAIMQQYNLYQFDNMSWSDYQNGAGSITYDGTVTPMMQKISDIAKNNLGTYPCTPDMCAAWVTGVYQAAGASIVPYGDAIDMWNVFKNTGSTDMSNIPPGAIVCGSGTGYMGSLYGHVGVYIGNGMVANNIGRFSIESLQSWCAWQTATCQGHTGWIGWIYPGGVPTE